MKNLAVATVILAVASLALRANAFEAGCCACLDLNATNQTAGDAFFCVAPAVDQVESLGERCAMITQGAELVCFKTIGNSSCQSALAGNGIHCPTSPAPAASSLNLTALAVVLAALGSLVLRRRRTP